MAVLLVDNIVKNDVEKQPTENIVITIDFTDELGSSGSISGYTTTAFDDSGTSVGTTILAGHTESSGIVSIGLTAGTHGETYTITSSVTSDQLLPDGNPQTFEADVKLKVKDVKWY
jgi:hypothetical protein